MYKYYMCLNDSNYNVKINYKYEKEIIINLESMLDNMINLLKEYGISDEEIIEELKDNVDIEIEEE